MNTSGFGKHTFLNIFGGDMMNDYTIEYNKDNMVQLKDDLDEQINRYSSLIEDLNTNVDAIGNYWVTSDSSSNDAYQNLKSKYQSYKASLEEGLQLLQEYSNAINEQVDRYQEAENRINNAIGE